MHSAFSHHALCYGEGGYYSNRYRDFAALAKLSSGLKSRLRDWRDGYLSTEVIRSRLEAAKIKLKTVSARKADRNSEAESKRKCEGTVSKGASSSSQPTMPALGRDGPDDASTSLPSGERIRKRRRFSQPSEQEAGEAAAVVHGDALVASAPPEPLLPEGWSRATDAVTGQEYYYNKTTLETSWEFPKATLPQAESAPEPPVDAAEDSTKKDAADVQTADVEMSSATADILKHLPLSTGDRLMNSFVAYFSDEGGTTTPPRLSRSRSFGLAFPHPNQPEVQRLFLVSAPSLLFFA
jgi:hypothetical protein